MTEMKNIGRCGPLLFLLAYVATGAAEADGVLYNDSHFHVQDFTANGPPLADIVEMMEGNIGRSVMMSIAVTIAHDPLVDRNTTPMYYSQTDAQALYYNVIQDVIVAHKYLALPQEDRARLDPLMNAFNVKDARAGDYIRKMVRMYPDVWSGFGEIHFKKEDFTAKIAGGAPSLYSSSLDAIFDTIGEMGATAVVHCDHDTPGNLALVKGPFGKILFGDEEPRPQYMDDFRAFLARHPDVTMIWAHFMGLSRNVGVYPDHWDYLDEMLADPAYAHVYVDLSWGPVITPHILDTPEHLAKTAAILRKYPDRFIYGSDQGATADWALVRRNYDIWQPVWDALGPDLTRRITVDNYARVWDRSRENIGAWVAKQPPLR